MKINRRKVLHLLCWCFSGSVALTLLLADVNSHPDRAAAETGTTGTGAESGHITLGGSAVAAAPTTSLARTKTTNTENPRLSQTLLVGKGDTLMAMMVEAGVARGGAHAAITALRQVYNPRRIQPGQKITLTFGTDPGQAPADTQAPGELTGLTVAAGADVDITVERTPADAYVAAEIKRPLTRRFVRRQGVIRHNLSNAANRAEIPRSVLHAFIRAYSWDVDFQRDIHPGDRFEIMYERFFNDEGTFVRDGTIAFASLTLGETRFPIYRYVGKDGTSDFFDANGHSVRRSLLRTPIDGARLSSRYGKRRHPILGFNKMHRGVDFAAPPGTPILAAGNGKVVFAGRNGAYGKYIRIRHNSEYSTAYAHLRRFAKGLRAGKRVQQGQVIGYVGSTGRSTGPHLHYEFMRQGRRTNPMTQKMPAGRKLKGPELQQFEAAMLDIDVTYAALPTDAVLARN